MIQNRSDHRPLNERLNDLNGMDRAANDAVREALRRHMLLGESVAVADDNGEARMLSPEEIRKALDA